MEMLHMIDHNDVEYLTYDNTHNLTYILSITRSLRFDLNVQ